MIIATGTTIRPWPGHAHGDRFAYATVVPPATTLWPVRLVLKPADKPAEIVLL